jgi:hypothetical protein
LVRLNLDTVGIPTSLSGRRLGWEYGLLFSSLDSPAQASRRESLKFELKAKHITSCKQALSSGRGLGEGKSDKHGFLIS